MITLVVDGTKIPFADSWDELPLKKQLELCRWMEYTEDPLTQRIALFMALIKVPKKIFGTTIEQRAFRSLVPEGKHELILNNDLYKIIINTPQFNRHPIPSFFHKGVRYHGPAHNLANVTGAEVIFAFPMFSEYVQTQDVDCLDRFIACLYRPVRWFNSFRTDVGDKRTAFNNYEIEKRARRISSMPHAKKKLIHVWFQACWAKIVEDFPLVFEKPAETGEYDPLGWQKIIMEISGGPFGPAEQTESTRFFKLLIEAERRMAIRKENAK